MQGSKRFKVETQIKDTVSGNYVWDDGFPSKEIVANGGVEQAKAQFFSNKDNADLLGKVADGSARVAFTQIGDPGFPA